MIFLITTVNWKLLIAPPLIISDEKIINDYFKAAGMVNIVAPLENKENKLRNRRAYTKIKLAYVQSSIQHLDTDY